MTKIAVDVADNTSELAVVLRFFSFFLGSLLSGILISSRKIGMGTELYGIVLMLVSALIFAGWLTATSSPAGVAPCLLALSMGLQNGMLTKHAHAVVRTTHMTGIATDIGVIIGHQLGRWLHVLALQRQLVDGRAPRNEMPGRIDMGSCVSADHDLARFTAFDAMPAELREMGGWVLLGFVS